MTVAVGGRDAVPPRAPLRFAPVLRPRALIALLALALALPPAAFGQGAGDRQYEDPFGGETAQRQGGGADDGLSPQPPQVPENGGPSAPSPEPESPAAPDEPATANGRLPDTGSDPRVLAFAGLAFLMLGVGLRLRTIDPDAY